MIEKIKIKAKLSEKVLNGEKILIEEEGIEGLKKIDVFLKK